MNPVVQKLLDDGPNQSNRIDTWIREAMWQLRFLVDMCEDQFKENRNLKDQLETVSNQPRIANVLSLEDRIRRLTEENAELKRSPVVWADEASPFTGAQVKELLAENDRMRRQLETVSSSPQAATTTYDIEGLKSLGRAIDKFTLDTTTRTWIARVIVTLDELDNECRRLKASTGNVSSFPPSSAKDIAGTLCMIAANHQAVPHEHHRKMIRDASEAIESLRYQLEASEAKRKRLYEELNRLWGEAMAYHINDRQEIVAALKECQ